MADGADDLEISRVPGMKVDSVAASSRYAGTRKRPTAKAEARNPYEGHLGSMYHRVLFL